MKKYLALIVALLVIPLTVWATQQSTINPVLPAQGSPLTSAPVRNNFQAAYSDINNIYSLVQNLGTVFSFNCTGGGTGLTCTVTNPTTTPSMTLGGTLNVANGGTGLTTIGTIGTCLKSTGSALIYGTCGGGGGGGTPGGADTDVQVNQAGSFFGNSGLTYNYNTNVLTASSIVAPLTGNVTGNLTGNVTGNLTGNTTGTSVTLNGATSGHTTLTASAITASGAAFQFPANNGAANFFLKTDGAGAASWTSIVGGASDGQVLYANGGAINGMATNSLESYLAHNSLENGLSYDARAPAYGAICGGYNTFAGNGSTVTFTYTIPFTGSSPTDNSNFMVFYEPTNGTGSATILNTSQFSVTGVNSGTGGTITLNSAPPAANTLIVVHDDSAGLVAASTAAAASGGYVAIPDGCTIYGSQANGTQLAEGAVLIGAAGTQNYGFAGQGIKPIMRVIAPTGAPPAFGINLSGKNQQYFKGFEITSTVSAGLASLGFLTVPVLIGANGSSGAGGGQNPGIVAEYMTFNSGKVGFGAPIGGNSNYIFAAVRFSNFTANTAGIYGPLSDSDIIGNDFASNGAFGSIGSSGGIVIGPREGAPGQSGAARIEYNRFEFNREGIVVQDGNLIHLEANEFDGNSACGLDLRTLWNNINITGGWFRGNANGGGSFPGNATAGQDAHICFNGGAGSGGLTVTNVNFFTNYSEGSTAPIGSPGATTPPYVMDFNTAGTLNDNIQVTDGQAQTIIGNNGAAITDFVVYRNGMPPNLKLNTIGQAKLGNGELITGKTPSQISSIPRPMWSSVVAFPYQGVASNPMWPIQIGSALNGGVTNNSPPSPYGSFYDCDTVQNAIFTDAAPATNGNPLYTWLPAVGDPVFGGGSTSHEASVHLCRTAGLTWLTIPSQYKTFAQSCTKSGSWSNNTDYGGTYGVTSHTNGDTLTCSVTTYGGPLYIWYQLNLDDGGTFTYSVDSGPTTTIPTNGGGNDFTFSSGTSSVGGARIPILTAGAHSVVFTVTSSTNVANTVNPVGLGTVPPLGYWGTTPSVYYGGQLYEYNDGNATWTANYDRDNKTDAMTLRNDGLNVNFVDVRPYLSPTADFFSSGPNSPYVPNQSGNNHLAQAYEAAAQFEPFVTSAPVVDPRSYGAVCNTQYFDGRNGSGFVSMTASSPVISVSGYTFSASDVGKTISVNGGGSTVQSAGVDTGTIISVDTGANTATLSVTPTITTSSGYGVFGNNDTAAFNAASAAAALLGEPMIVPTNCGVTNFTPTSGSTITGQINSLGYNYTPDVKPILYILNTAWSEDSQKYGINIGHLNSSIALVGFSIKGLAFPSLIKHPGMVLACVGTDSGTAAYNQGVELDHMTINSCPVGFGTAYGSLPTNHIFARLTNNQFGNNGWGVYAQLSDSIDIGSVYTSNFIGGMLLGITGSSGGFLSASNRLIGVRFEGPNGVGLWCDGCIETHLEGVEFQFLGGGPITLNKGWSNFHVTGGFVQGSFGGAFFSGYISGTTLTATTVPYPPLVNGMQVSLNGTAANTYITAGATGTYGETVFTVNNSQTVGSSGSPVTLEGGNSAAITLNGVSAVGNLHLSNVMFYTSGGTGKYNYIIQSYTSGANNPLIEIDGGTLNCNTPNAAYNTALDFWPLGRPTFYKITTQNCNQLILGPTDFSINASSGVGIGTSAAANKLDIAGAVAIGTSYVGTVTAPTNGLVVQGAVAIGTSAAAANSLVVQGSMGIGTSTPGADAALDMSAKTTTTLRLPNGTTGGRPGSPGAGDLWFNTSTTNFEGWNGSAWNTLGAYSAPVKISLRTVTAAGAVTVSATTDYFVCINKTSGAATAVNLPATPATGLLFIIKDCKGDAASHNITVTPAAGTIDGSVSYVMNAAYQTVGFVYNGTEWSVE